MPIPTKIVIWWLPHVPTNYLWQQIYDQPFLELLCHYQQPLPLHIQPKAIISWHGFSKRWYKSTVPNLKKCINSTYVQLDNKVLTDKEANQLLSPWHQFNDHQSGGQENIFPQTPDLSHFNILRMPLSPLWQQKWKLRPSPTYIFFQLIL